MKKRMIGISANGKKFLLNVKEEDGKLVAGTDFTEKPIDIPVEEPIAVEEIVEVEVPNEIITLRNQFENYILSQKGILADSTLKGYENVKDKHLKSIMDKDVSMITEKDILNALDEELANGIAYSTMTKYSHIVSKVLASANVN